MCTVIAISSSAHSSATTLFHTLRAQDNMGRALAGPTTPINGSHDVLIRHIGRLRRVQVGGRYNIRDGQSVRCRHSGRLRHSLRP